MNFQEFKEKTKNSNILAQVDTLGSYDIYTSTICLDSLKQWHLDAALKEIRNTTNGKYTGEQYCVISKAMPLVVHEYAHFIDFTSTLWGLNHLRKMNEAYISGITSKENGFYRAKDFFDHVRGIRLPKYYNKIHDDKENTLPWSATLSVGMIFSSQGRVSQRALIFYNFYNKDNELLVRSPISLLSLLEASAMAQEVLFNAAILSDTEDDFKIIEQNDFERKNLNYLYNPSITEYSVCVHMIANLFRHENALISFHICLLIVRLTLNFPRNYFSKVSAYCRINLNKNHGFDKISIKRITDNLDKNDLGTLYYIICIELSKTLDTPDPQEIQDGIVLMLKRMGIDYYKFIVSCQEEANLLAKSLCASSIKSISILASAGHDNFNKIIEDRKNMPILGKLNTPPALLGDGTIHSCLNFHDGNLLKNFNIEQCFDELHDGQRWVENFAEACL